MKKQNLKKVITTILVPSVLLPACNSSSFFLEDDVTTINSRAYTGNGVAVPIDLDLTSKDQKLLNFIVRLSNDIIQNPLIAKKFSEDPQAIAKSYKITNLQIDFNDPFWNLIKALGDEDLNKAITQNDISLFLSLCSEKGLINDLKQSELCRYIEQLGPNDSPTVRSGVMAVPVAVFVGVVAGCAAGVEAAVLYHETYWWTDGSESQATMSQRDAQAYQLWALKKGAEDTHIMLSEYQEKILNDCIDGLQKYFPERIEGINMVELRQFISINMPK